MPGPGPEGGQGLHEREEISIRGSSALVVTEFFAFAVNSILYQRGVYPAETFQPQKRYGTTVMVTTNAALTAYITTVLEQMTEWLQVGDLQKMVLVVSERDRKRVVERWSFDIQTDTSAGGKENVSPAGSEPRQKSEKEVTAEIQAIIRLQRQVFGPQITASVTFLPLLEDACTFDLIVHTRSRAPVPITWEDSDPRNIEQAADVQLRSFDTKVHKVDTLVSYRTEAADG